MYLLFDIGGTNMRIATSLDDKTVNEPKIIPTPYDFQQGLKIIKTAAVELSKGQKIEAVAGGAAGPLDKNQTMLVKSPHIKDWVDKPLKKELEKIFGTSVHLENDADLAALGEAVFGTGVGKNIVAYLTISTGVGGGRVVGGKIDKNALGFEPGHQIIVIDGNSCNCGGKGHLESYIGGWYLEKLYGKRGEEIDSPDIWDGIAKYLAIGLQNTIVHWSPDIVVLGGSVSQNIPLEKIRDYLKAYLTIFPECPIITKSSLGNKAGLFGALALLQK